MANLPAPKVIQTTIYSQFVYHFEIDVENMRIKTSAYDRDENGDRIDSTVRHGEWIEMMNGASPNLPQDKWAVFADAMPLVTDLAIAYGKLSGVIDEDATV